MDDLELLRRHAPAMRFDKAERWRPQATAAYLAGSSLLAGDEVLDALGVAETQLTNARKAQRLDPLHGAHRGDRDRSRRLQKVLGAAIELDRSGTCYGRVVPGTSPPILQYWCFYADNPPLLAQFGRHDGDWELVQLRLSEDRERCTAVTLAQHGHPETRDLPDGRPPTVFVARHSHAAYLRAGTQPRRPVPDHCDPGPAPVDALQVLALPEEGWVAWSGRWGDDRGLGSGLARRLKLRRTPGFLRWVDRRIPLNSSPESPAAQGAWKAASYERKGRVRAKTTVRVREAVHRAGAKTWPQQPSAVTVAPVGDGRLRLAVAPAGHGVRRTRTTVVELLDADARPVADHQLPAGGEEVVAAPPEAVAWRATDYNLLRQPGETTAPQPLA